MGYGYVTWDILCYMIAMRYDVCPWLYFVVKCYI